MATRSERPKHSHPRAAFGQFSFRQSCTPRPPKRAADLFDWILSVCGSNAYGSLPARAASDGNCFRAWNHSRRADETRRRNARVRGIAVRAQRLGVSRLCAQASLAAAARLCAMVPQNDVESLAEAQRFVLHRRRESIGNAMEQVILRSFFSSGPWHPPFVPPTARCFSDCRRCVEARLRVS